MENIKGENNYITKEQEEAFNLLLHSMDNILREDGKENLNMVITSLEEGEAGHHSKLTVKELAQILLGEILGE